MAVASCTGLASALPEAFCAACPALALRPLALARWALRDDPGWTDARIRAAMRAGWERVSAGMVETESGPLLVVDVAALIAGAEAKAA